MAAAGWAGLLLLVAALVPHALAKYTLQESGLRVLFPVEHKVRMTMAMADFGEPKYGGTMTGQLVYPTEEQNYYPKGIKPHCAPEACQYACQPYNQSYPPYSIKKEPGMFYIMMVDRGPRASGHNPCYFLSKVYNAQMAGADAVIVANDEPGELSTAVAPDDESTAGQLAALKVSAALLSLEDANTLRGLLQEGPVTVTLNWSDILPRRTQVSWELWTNSNDECGVLCDTQRNFITNIKATAQALDKANLTLFSPHYLLWSCPREFWNTTECTTECVMNGTYCVPDPDNNVRKGYTGRDALIMNMYQLCFSKLATAAGRSGLWWDYMAALQSNCSMKAQNYTLDCATQVFNALGGASLAPNDSGLARWQSCAYFNESAALPNDNSTWHIPLLDAELDAQHGANGTDQDTVSINPTVRINGVQYRGTLDAPSVTRALCAGFPQDQEPAVCNEQWVSEDECLPGNEGYIACHSDDHLAVNQTRCINTFSGYRCDCQRGWMRMTDPDTGADSCEDVNECLATNIPLTNPACSCDRCACVNSVGSYSCTGPLENKCTSAANYGGCWQQTIDGEFFHGCQDALWEYQRLAARGMSNSTTQWFRCGCPRCFKSDGAGGCVPSCDLKLCDRPTGFCMPKPDATPVPGPGKSSGVGIGGIMMIAFATALLTGGLVFMANRLYNKRNMSDEIKSIMGQYMALDDRAGGGSNGLPHGSGGRRAGLGHRDYGAEGYAPPGAWTDAEAAVPLKSSWDKGSNGASSGDAMTNLGGGGMPAAQRHMWGPVTATAAPPPPPSVPLAAVRSSAAAPAVPAAPAPASPMAPGSDPLLGIDMTDADDKKSGGGLL